MDDIESTTSGPPSEMVMNPSIQLEFARRKPLDSSDLLTGSPGWVSPQARERQI